MATTREPRSLVMHSAARHYDLLAWALTLGREREVRERIVDVARLEEGETVLDVGCSTGTLAVAVKRRVGARGSVRGVDASEEMIEQAREKAAGKAVDIGFDVARAEALPVGDASVDAVLGTLMMHHLPRPVRESFAREIHRVLTPGGRVLIVDFEPPSEGRRGLISRVHRHGHVPLEQIVEILIGAGLQVTETGSLGISDLRYAIAIKSEDVSSVTRTSRDYPALPLPRWIVAPALVLVVVLAHVFMLSAAASAAALGVGVFALLVFLAHGGMVGGIHEMMRRHRLRRK